MKIYFILPSAWGRLPENEKNKVSKVSYFCIVPKQNAAILPTKIKIRQMTINELSIIDGLPLTITVSVANVIIIVCS